VRVVYEVAIEFENDAPITAIPDVANHLTTELLRRADVVLVERVDGTLTLLRDQRAEVTGGR